MYLRILLIACFSVLLTTDSIWHTGNAGTDMLYATEESVLDQKELTGDYSFDIILSLHIRGEEAYEHHSINDLLTLKAIIDIPFPPPKMA